MLHMERKGNIRNFQHLQSSERNTILGLQESAFKMALSHGYWQEVSFPCHLGLSIGLLKCLWDIAAGFP